MSSLIHRTMVARACAAVNVVCAAIAAISAQVPAIDLLRQHVTRDPSATESQLDGCVRLHHVWKGQLLAASGPAAARERTLLDTVFTPNADFWAGYLGDQAAFTKWTGGMKPLLDDSRLSVPMQARLGDMITETTRRMEQLTSRRACGDWFIVYGPGWTNLGGLGNGRMVLDVLGLPVSDPIGDVRFALPHEINHLLFEQARSPGERGTLIYRMIDEGLASFAADEYWGAGVSPADALGYTQAQWDWAVAHEQALWREAQPHLDSIDRKVLDRFSSASQQLLPGAPGKAGYFLGFRIVEDLVRREGALAWRKAYEMPLKALVAASRFR